MDSHCNFLHLADLNLLCNTTRGQRKIRSLAHFITIFNFSLPQAREVSITWGIYLSVGWNLSDKGKLWFSIGMGM